MSLDQKEEIPSNVVNFIKLDRISLMLHRKELELALNNETSINATETTFEKKNRLNHQMVVLNRENSVKKPSDQSDGSLLRSQSVKMLLNRAVKRLEINTLERSFIESNELGDRISINTQKTELYNIDDHVVPVKEETLIVKETPIQGDNPTVNEKELPPLPTNQPIEIQKILVINQKQFNINSCTPVIPKPRRKESLPTITEHHSPLANYSPLGSFHSVEHENETSDSVPPSLEMVDLGQTQNLNAGPTKSSTKLTIKTLQIPTRTTSKSPTKTNKRELIFDVSVPQIVKTGSTKKRSVFLFNDCIVITSNRNNHYQVKHIFSHQDMKFTRPSQLPEKELVFNESLLESLSIHSLEYLLTHHPSNERIIPYLHCQTRIHQQTIVLLLSKPNFCKMLAEYVKYLPLNKRGFDECITYLYGLFREVMGVGGLLLDTVILTWIQFNGSHGECGYVVLKQRAIEKLIEIKLSLTSVIQKHESDKSSGNVQPLGMMKRLKSLVRNQKLPSRGLAVKKKSCVQLKWKVTRVSGLVYECVVKCTDKSLMNMNITPISNYMVKCTPPFIQFMNLQTMYKCVMEFSLVEQQVVYFQLEGGVHVTPLLLTTEIKNDLGRYDHLLTFMVNDGKEAVSLCKKYAFVFEENELREWEKYIFEEKEFGMRERVDLRLKREWVDRVCTRKELVDGFTTES